MRNKVSFHYDAAALLQQFDSEDMSGHYEFVASTDYTNTLFISSEAASAFAVLRFFSSNKQAAMDAFYAHTSEAAGHAMIFATAVAIAVLRRSAQNRRGWPRF